VQASQFPRVRLGFVIALTCACVAQLLWQQWHGGVPSHHFLARADMPAISNWWGALLVPVLAWTLTGLVQARLKALGPDRVLADAALSRTLLAFAGALTYGATLALLFTLDPEHQALSVLFFGLPVVGLFLPVFRAEYVLGLYLGMLLTFGPVIPLVLSLALALISALLQVLLRPIVRRLVRVAR
jgi:hypothetical protein